MTESLTVVTPEERAEREREGASLMTFAEALVILDAERFATAAQWLREVVIPLRLKIRETFRPRIEQAHALHKGLLSDERRFLAPVEQAEALVRGRLVAYEQDQARLRREAELVAQRERDRLEQEAREQAEAERCRLHAEAEGRRIAEAALLEARGDLEAAHRLLDQPITAPVVTPLPVFAPRPPIATPPTVEGVSFRTAWKWRLVDEAKLPRQYLQADEKAITAVVRAMGKRTAIPGIEVYEERISSVRSA